MDSFLEIVEINDIKYNISGNRKFYAFSFDEYQREREREEWRVSAKETGCLARSSRTICFAVARSQVIKFPLSARGDTSFLFAWGAFIARFHIEKRGYASKDLAPSLFELLRHYLLGDLDVAVEQTRARFLWDSPYVPLLSI